MFRQFHWAGVLLAITCLIGTPSAQTARFDLASLLTTYSSGRFDDAIRAVQRAGDGAAQGLRDQWGAARGWIAADPGARNRRYLAVAAFALETERLRAERNDWAAEKSEDCAGRCVVEWAGLLLLERGDPDEAERVWWQAAAAVASGVRDWGFLVNPVDARQPFGLGTGMLHRALERFPDDPRFRLDQAIAVASRFNITTDGEPRSVASPLTAALAGFPNLVVLEEQTRPQRQTVLASAIAELTALCADATVGAEARVRLGYLHWATGHDEAARTELSSAAAASDPDVRYLANFLVGIEAQARHETAAAMAAFAAALEARPHSESASLALAALELQRGDAERAYARAREPFAERPGDTDPWRQFLYGPYPRLPALVAELRAQVTR
jgi:hypothetical protein